MTISLRPLTPADHEALNRVALELHAHHIAGAPDVFRMPEYMFEPGWIAEINAQEDHFLRGVFDDATLVGFVFAHTREWLDDPQQVSRRWAVVQMIGVAADYRNQGIGERLMAAAESWARERDIKVVTLGVWAFNAGAIRFYERLGYDSFLVQMRRELPE